MEKPDSPVAGIEILFQCMKDIADNLVEHLSHKEYQWSADRGEKIFECLVLSKFFLDHALLTTYASKIDEGRIKLRLQMINSVFKTMLGSTLSGDKFKTERLIHIDDLASEIHSQWEKHVEMFKDTINNRLALYSNALTEHPHPRCWVMVATICTGIDHYENKNLYAITGGVVVLANLLMYAQDSLKLIYGE